MRRIYMVQHGEATSEDVDPSRPLTQKGREDVEKVRDFIKGLNLEISSIRHSGKRRALQTAEILSQAITPRPDLIHYEGMLPNDPVEPVYKEIKEGREDVMLVGHLPFLSRIASMFLIEREEETINFHMGGVVCLVGEGDGRFRVDWIIIPEIIK